MIEKDYCITFIPILESESGQPDVLNCQQVFLKLSESKANSLQKMFEADNNLGFIIKIEELILN